MTADKRKRQLRAQTERVFDESTLAGHKQAERYKEKLELRTFETAERTTVKCERRGLDKWAYWMEEV